MSDLKESHSRSLLVVSALGLEATANVYLSCCDSSFGAYRRGKGYQASFGGALKQQV